MDSENSIFRVRPVNENTHDELVNCYLWFSKPEGFRGDTSDANISAFVTETPAIERGFKYVNPDFPFDKWYKGLSNTGICCFTRELPLKSRLRKFPGCTSANAICIEYDKQKIESFFERHRTYPIVPCFRKIQYSHYPTKIDSCDEWSILWKIGEGYKMYRTIPNILYSHPRELDKLIYILLTRISSKFKRQKEERIILGAALAPSDQNSAKGYRIPIDNDMIRHVYIYAGVSHKQKFIISQIPNIKDKIVFL